MEARSWRSAAFRPWTSLRHASTSDLRCRRRKEDDDDEEGGGGRRRRRMRRKEEEEEGGGGRRRRRRALLVLVCKLRKRESISESLSESPSEPIKTTSEAMDQDDNLPSTRRACHRLCARA
eukprot:3200116-Rhodomonas_salina.1